jgi:hypothetical protein
MDMKLLKNIELPEGFEYDASYKVEVDENPEVIYEGCVFTTELSFEAASLALEAFLSKHYGPLKKTDGKISMVLTCSLPAQEITAQITNSGECCGGYLNSRIQWSWGYKR